MWSPVLFGFTLLLICHLSYAEEKFRCFKGSFDNFEDVPVSEGEKLLTATDPCLDKDKPTDLLISGYKYNNTGPMPTAIISSLIRRGGRNVMLLNWEEEAGDGIFGPGLGYLLNAVPNTRRVGEAVGDALARMVEEGLNKDIKVIGFSLGAHAAGYAGSQAMEKGLTIKQIVALDPARRGFDPGLYQSVSKDNAEYVSIVHCDIGGYGTNRSRGHADFWTNFDRYIERTRRQPGCAQSSTTEERLTAGNRCSHDRCWQYYNVALSSERLFEAGLAEDYHEFVEKNGDFEHTAFIGPLDRTDNHGDYYLQTDAISPWGRGALGLKANP